MHLCASRVCCPIVLENISGSASLAPLLISTCAETPIIPMAQLLSLVFIDFILIVSRNGLWSLTMVQLRPSSRRCLYRSSANLMPSISRSEALYFRCSLVSRHDWYAHGLSSPVTGSSCANTAPIAIWLVSARMTALPPSGFHGVRMMSDFIMDLSCRIDFFCSSPQYQSTSFFVNSYSGASMCDRFGQLRLKYCMLPHIDLISDGDLGTSLIS